VDAGSVLIVLYLALIALCGTAIWALFAVVRTARATTQLAEDLDARLLPLIDKASVTVDALNVELERVDGIVTQLEEVSDTVTSTTRAAQGLVNVPAIAMAGLGDRARRLASILFGRRV
jgi:cell division FtsZ-interacting protein ZapD